MGFGRFVKLVIEDCWTQSPTRLVRILFECKSTGKVEEKYHKRKSQIDSEENKEDRMDDDII